MFHVHVSYCVLCLVSLVSCLLCLVSCVLCLVSFFLLDFLRCQIEGRINERTVSIVVRSVRSVYLSKSNSTLITSFKIIHTHCKIF